MKKICDKCGVRGVRYDTGMGTWLVCITPSCPDFKKPLHEGYKKQARSRLFSEPFGDGGDIPEDKKVQGE